MELAVLLYVIYSSYLRVHVVQKLEENDTFLTMKIQILLFVVPRQLKARFTLNPLKHSFCSEVHKYFVSLKRL